MNIKLTSTAPFTEQLSGHRPRQSPCIIHLVLVFVSFPLVSTFWFLFHFTPLVPAVYFCFHTLSCCNNKLKYKTSYKSVLALFLSHPCSEINICLSIHLSSLDISVIFHMNSSDTHTSICSATFRGLTCLYEDTKTGIQVFAFRQKYFPYFFLDKIAYAHFHRNCIRKASQSSLLFVVLSYSLLRLQSKSVPPYAQTDICLTTNKY